jgi:hypothetical protein
MQANRLQGQMDIARARLPERRFQQPHWETAAGSAKSTGCFDY